LWGGERLKIGDVMIAVATMAVVVAFIAYLLDLVFVPALGLVNGYAVSYVVYGLVSAIVAGAVFAGKIQESRKEAIAKITVVWGLFWFLLANVFTAFSADGTYATQQYAGQYGTNLSAEQWAYWQFMYTDMAALTIVGIAVVTAIVGLYIGSMLRKPKKT
jgi:hypothetical protein